MNSTKPLWNGRMKSMPTRWGLRTISSTLHPGSVTNWHLRLAIASCLESRSTPLVSWKNLNSIASAMCFRLGSKVFLAMSSLLTLFIERLKRLSKLRIIKKCTTGMVVSPLFSSSLIQFRPMLRNSAMASMNNSFYPLWEPEVPLFPWSKRKETQESTAPAFRESFPISMALHRDISMLPLVIHPQMLTSARPISPVSSINPKNSS